VPDADVVQRILCELEKSPKGILDLGAKTDCYQQAEESAKLMPQLLSALADAGQPTFIATKSSLILRDLDLLKEMATGGLIEVNFTLITLNEAVRRSLEPGAPSCEERLRAAAYLSDARIPVSFHLSPLIPGLLSEQEIYRLIRAIKSVSGRHAFCCILGGRRSYWEQLVVALEGIKDEFCDWSLFRSVYGNKEDFDDITRAQASNHQCLIETMVTFMQCCKEIGVGFVCENIPAFTDIRLDGGIYRWKLPTVCDMMDYISARGGPVGWEEFAKEFLERFKPSSELRGLLATLWNSRSLFTNTTLRSESCGEGILYCTGGELVVGQGGVLAVGGGRPKRDGN